MMSVRLLELLEALQRAKTAIAANIAFRFYTGKRNIQYTTNSVSQIGIKPFHLTSFSFLNHFLQSRAQDTTSIRRAKFGRRNVN